MTVIRHVGYGIDLRCAMCEGAGDGCRYCDGEGTCTVCLDAKYVPTSQLVGAVNALRTLLDATMPLRVSATEDELDRLAAARNVAADVLGGQ